MNNKFLKAALAGLILSVSGFANAVLINIEHTYDINNLSSIIGSQNLAFSENVIINEGDTVKYVLDFSGSQSVSVVGMTSWFSWFLQDYSGTGSNFTIDNAYTNFIGASSQPATTSTESNGSVHIGTINNFAPTDLQFTGIEFGFHVVDFVNMGPFEFKNQWWILQANSYAISGASDSNTEGFSVDYIDVPEPSTLAFLGLGLIGLAARRFKRQA